MMTMTDPLKKPHICDFCTEHPADWFYEVDPIIGEKQGDPIEGEPPNVDWSRWFACAACSKFIEQEDMKSLVERALEVQLTNRGLAEVSGFKDKEFLQRTQQQLRNHLYQIYVQFWKYRKGVREPYDWRV